MLPVQDGETVEAEVCGLSLCRCRLLHQERGVSICPPSSFWLAITSSWNTWCTNSRWRLKFSVAALEDWDSHDSLKLVGSEYPNLLGSLVNCGQKAQKWSFLALRVSRRSRRAHTALQSLRLALVLCVIFLCSLHVFSSFSSSSISMANPVLSNRNDLPACLDIICKVTIQRE